MTEMITRPTPARSCAPDTRVTRSLLAYGVLAGPVYVVVSLAQALSRDGFVLTRHEWSLLSNGDLGWIQITNLLLSGLMVLAAAAGLRRALRGGRAGTWAPILVGGYGIGLIGAAVFRADPSDGFPVGTPPGRATEVSWPGLAHLASAGTGFLLLVAACFVVAGRFAADGERGWATYSRVTGIVFLAGFAAIASGSGSPAVVIAFTIAVLSAWAWLAALTAVVYRRAGA